MYSLLRSHEVRPHGPHTVNYYGHDVILRIIFYATVQCTTDRTEPVYRFFVNWQFLCNFGRISGEYGQRFWSLLPSCLQLRSRPGETPLPSYAAYDRLLDARGSVWLVNEPAVSRFMGKSQAFILGRGPFTAGTQSSLSLILDLTAGRRLIDSREFR